MNTSEEQSADCNIPLRVSLVATPDTQVAPLSGLYETLGAFGLLAGFEPDLPRHPFEVEIVAPGDQPILGASGLPLGAHRSYREVDQTDIVIIPLMMANGPDWVSGRYPGVVDWLRKMHSQGATLCSACTGVLLLAETGLLDHREATLHWAFASTFRHNFPCVRLRTTEALIVAGDNQEFIMTGGVMSWHDLALYLIARHVGPSAAQAIARLLMLQWHSDGQAPYTSFTPATNHSDSIVLELQQWLQHHYKTVNPVDGMVQATSMPRRSVERRFVAATGYTPIAYVQNLRVEKAKRRLERTRISVDEISHEVGYENAAFFRRVFKRITHLTPGSYRRRFAIHPLNIPD